jgi:hypothetical protein
VQPAALGDALTPLGTPVKVAIQRILGRIKLFEGQIEGLLSDNEELWKKVA